MQSLKLSNSYKNMSFIEFDFLFETSYHNIKKNIVNINTSHLMPTFVFIPLKRDMEAGTVNHSSPVCLACCYLIFYILSFYLINNIIAFSHVWFIPPTKLLYIYVRVHEIVMVSNIPCILIFWWFILFSFSYITLFYLFYLILNLVL